MQCSDEPTVLSNILVNHMNLNFICVPAFNIDQYSASINVMERKFLQGGIVTTRMVINQDNRDLLAVSLDQKDAITFHLKVWESPDLRHRSMFRLWRTPKLEQLLANGELDVDTVAAEAFFYIHMEERRSCHKCNPFGLAVPCVCLGLVPHQRPQSYNDGATVKRNFLSHTGSYVAHCQPRVVPKGFGACNDAVTMCGGTSGGNLPGVVEHLLACGIQNCFVRDPTSPAKTPVLRISDAWVHRSHLQRTAEVSDGQGQTSGRLILPAGGIHDALERRGLLLDDGQDNAVVPSSDQISGFVQRGGRGSSSIPLGKTEEETEEAKLYRRKLRNRESAARYNLRKHLLRKDLQEQLALESAKIKMLETKLDALQKKNAALRQEARADES